MKKLIQFELRKIFSKRLTQIALLFVLFFSAILGFSSYQNKYAFDGVSKEGTGKTAVEIDKEIAAKYEGVLTDEKVQQMMNDFAAQTNLHGMNAAYLYHNALQSAVFTRFSDMNGNWNGVRVSDAFGGEEVRIGYVDGWLTTSQNMVKIFFILSLVIVIMTAPVFCGEYGGVDNIILTSRYGRTKCGAAKVGAGLIAAFIVTLAVAAVNILFAFVLYGRDGLNCSVLFAPMPFDKVMFKSFTAVFPPNCLVSPTVFKTMSNFLSYVFMTSITRKFQLFIYKERFLKNADTIAPFGVLSMFRYPP